MAQKFFTVLLHLQLEGRDLYFGGGVHSPASRFGFTS
jgi:hypothetical protein